MEWIRVGGAGSGAMDGMRDVIGSTIGSMLVLLAAVLLFRLGLDLLAATIRRARKGRGRAGPRPPAPFFRRPGRRAMRDRTDLAAEQMRVVGDSQFERVRLLNSEEARLLPILERVAREVGQGHRVMAQTSLGEVIRPVAGSPDEAYAAINSKRLDFALFDRRGLIVCAVEYQGTGHWQEQAAMRDGIKREALRKAGVRVVEVHPDFVEATLMQSVRDLLRPSGRCGTRGGEGQGT